MGTSLPYHADSTFLLSKTAAKGGLRSITDSTAQHAPGQRWTEITSAGYRRVYLYAYNATGSAMAQNTIYLRSWGAAGTNPNFIAKSDAANMSLKGIAQSAIPATYWGWFQIEGPTENRASTGSLNATDGQGLSIEAGAAIALTTLGQTDEKDFATVTETRNNTTLHLWLFGKETLDTATS